MHIQKNSHRRQKNYPRVEDGSCCGDIIDGSLHEDGHRAWGFVIYRCAYDSDSDWGAFMRRLLADTEEDVYCDTGEQDLLNNLAITVFEDRDAFDRATAATVREHFRKWAATAPQREQGTSYIQPPGHGFSSQRYRYCLQVGREELESVLRPDQVLSSLYFSFVRLVDTYWEPNVGPALDLEEEYQRLRAESEGNTWIYDTDEPVEGCRDWNVGWMRINFSGAMVDPYAALREDYQWDVVYCRPPSVTSFW
ncbi:hypothetical protein BJY01DRAFT_220346 [Aspergillus pseudoustus]|uniref:Uncharacterized protein n=1 Tax=Aspergillus pseudoustus TaxID=1810923 RepID=A0ABR4JD11_9EURO